MRLVSGYEERRARIELAPLIDCMFLLLVFFMYAMTSMTVQRGMRVRLPAGTGAVQRATVTVTIAADNTVRLGDRELGVAEAVEAVAALARAEQAPVTIAGDRASDLGVALDLLSRLREAGVDSVSFLVQREAP